jgi:hypothetical protein
MTPDLIKIELNSIWYSNNQCYYVVAVQAALKLGWVAGLALSQGEAHEILSIGHIMVATCYSLPNIDMYV